MEPPGGGQQGKKPQARGRQPVCSPPGLCSGCAACRGRDRSRSRAPRSAPAAAATVSHRQKPGLGCCWGEGGRTRHTEGLQVLALGHLGWGRAAAAAPSVERAGAGKPPHPSPGPSGGQQELPPPLAHVRVYLSAEYSVTKCHRSSKQVGGVSSEQERQRGNSSCVEVHLFCKTVAAVSINKHPLFKTDSNATRCHMLRCHLAVHTKLKNKQRKMLLSNDRAGFAGPLSGGLNFAFPACRAENKRTFQL